ncbi:MAG: formyltransferase family protein [Thermomicrobiales bacterium]
MRGLGCDRMAAGEARVVVLGQSCGATAPPLAALIEAGFEVAGLILAGALGEDQGEPECLATAAGIPLRWAASAADATRVIRELAPDIGVAACFPWRLGRAARETPSFGILNLHPSLLPADRGPEPVFWTLRRGERTTGVTVHRMDAGLDTGPIVAQGALPVPEGIAAPDLERQLMARGGALLTESLPALLAGTLHPWPQTGIASYAPFPAPADWTMLASLPAAWAWRFACGVAPLGGPLTAIAADEVIPVAAALDWSPDERLPDPVISHPDGTVQVRFSPGWVRFQRRA